MAAFEWGKEHLGMEKAMELLEMSSLPPLGPEALKRLKDSRAHVEEVLESEHSHYGINTGFGPLCDTQVSAEQSGQLQQNLLLSHAVGVGSPIAVELSKLMLICKIHALCRGYSGVRIALVERLYLFLEKDWIPTKNGHSLYIRPLMFATDPYLGVKAGDQYKFMIIFFII